MKVSEKDVFLTEKMPQEPGESVTVTEVLLYNDKDTEIGAPFVKGASVTLEVKSHGKAKKVRVFKMKAKKRYRRERGHRQQFTKVEVTKVGAPS